MTGVQTCALPILEQDVSAKAGKQGVKTLSAADGSQLQDSDGSYLHKIGRARVGKECRSRWSPYH